jgi:hypothetical protein
LELSTSSDDRRFGHRTAGSVVRVVGDDGL